MRKRNREKVKSSLDISLLYSEAQKNSIRNELTHTSVLFSKNAIVYSVLFLSLSFSSILLIFITNFSFKVL